jgi:asparagine synthase (glutamine-hydrolysing)
MCGFTAFFSRTGIEERHLQALTRCNRDMRHRGPDEEDVWHDSRVALGHVRLSIIGVANGHQPIFNEDRTVVLVCNGEIYNYRVLRRRLEARGHRFATESDSEVIVHLYEEQGEALCDQLDGMFAFCLYDARSGNLLLARDRLGKKPLYYARTYDGIVFSSELEVIRTQFLRKAEPNLEVLRQTQQYSYPIDLEETWVTEIRRVPPACHLLVTQDTAELQCRRYYQRRIDPSFSGSYREACAEVLRLLVAAVEKRLQSEVPVAVLLSAGIDSSAIAAIARTLRNDVHVISAGYAGHHHVDERAAARRLSQDLGLVWHDVELHEETFVNGLEPILARLDEPNGDVAMFAQWDLYRQARAHGFTVLLSGNGGDELFFGYPSHNAYATALEWLEAAKARYPTLSARHAVRLVVDQLLARLRGQEHYVLDRLVPQELPVMAELEAMVEQSSRFRPHLKRSDWHRLGFPNALDRVYHFLSGPWLANNCYFLADKLAMAHSIEVRSPFADRALMDFVDTLPLHMKFPDGKAKQLLKDSVRETLPPYVLDRTKTGFTPPTNFVRTAVANYTPKVFTEVPCTLAQLATDGFLSRLVQAEFRSREASR